MYKLKKKHILKEFLYLVILDCYFMEELHAYHFHGIIIHLYHH